MGSPNKRFMQSIGLASGDDSNDEMRSKVHDLCEHVFSEYEISYDSKEASEVDDGYCCKYYFKWQGKKFVLIANLTYSQGHLRASIWSNPTTQFYTVLCSSEVHRYYPMQVYMTEQMEDFLLNKYSESSSVEASPKKEKKKLTKKEEEQENRAVIRKLKWIAVAVLVFCGWFVYNDRAEESVVQKCFNNHIAQFCYDKCVAEEGSPHCKRIFGQVIKKRILAGKTETDLKKELGIK